MPANKVDITSPDTAWGPYAILGGGVVVIKWLWSSLTFKDSRINLLEGRIDKLEEMLDQARTKIFALEEQNGKQASQLSQLENLECLLTSTCPNRKLLRDGTVAAKEV